MSRNALTSTQTTTRKVLALTMASVAILASCTKENLSGPSTAEPRAAKIEGANDGNPPRKRDFTESTSESDRFAIRLERQRCYGMCPAYVIEISESGLVHYTGIRYVKQRGEVTKQLSKAEMDRLKKEFDRVDFLSMSWKDPCDQVATDNPTVITTLVTNNRKRTIEHYHGNRCFPPKLSELENAIDEIVGTKAWTKCPRSDGTDFCGP